MDLNSTIDGLKDEIIEQTQKLIRVKSVQGQEKPGMPYGEGINDALLTTLQLGEKLGFRSRNLNGYMGYIEWGEGEEIVGILAHLDVVPEGDNWDYEPYEGKVENGKLYGRGTLDDKGPAIASLYGMYALKQTGFKPNKRIRLLLGTNEESGCHEVEYYLKHDESPTIGFTPDGYFPVIFAEKGITFFNIVKNFKEKENNNLVYMKGGNRPNMVPDYCEVGLKNVDKEVLMRKTDAFAQRSSVNLTYVINEDMLVIKSKGISAHGSTPQYGKNAIMQLINFLNSVEVCTGEVGEAIKFLAAKIGMETNGESIEAYMHDDVSGDLTFNVGTIEMNEDMISIGVNVRYPVTLSLEGFMDPLKANVNEAGFSIEGLMHQPALYYPKDHKLIKILSKVYEKHTGQPGDPIAIGGGTYAKEMPNIVAFGPIFPGKPDLDHQANEYIEVDDLIQITKIYGDAIKELAES
ncbi:MAG: dipeptidase [Clostridiaceae bacterium]|jgi:succinyl-diaminopimelate desuccinylase|nr:dipeptidase [Clostridiaceae bacterium]